MPMGLSTTQKQCRTHLLKAGLMIVGEVHFSLLFVAAQPGLLVLKISEKEKVPLTQASDGFLPQIQTLALPPATLLQRSKSLASLACWPSEKSSLSHLFQFSHQTRKKTHVSPLPHTGFRRKEFRGKLAIAITANFINRNSTAEAKVEEISGVAFIFNQKFFQDLKEETGGTFTFSKLGHKLGHCPCFSEMHRGASGFPSSWDLETHSDNVEAGIPLYGNNEQNSFRDKRES